MAYAFPSPRRYALPFDGPICRCNYTGHDPDPDRGFATWTWQITSDCPSHFRPLPVSARVRILIDEGVRL